MKWIAKGMIIVVALLMMSSLATIEVFAKGGGGSSGGGRSFSAQSRTFTAPKPLPSLPVRTYTPAVTPSQAKPAKEVTVTPRHEAPAKKPDFDAAARAAQERAASQKKFKEAQKPIGSPTPSPRKDVVTRSYTTSDGQSLQVTIDRKDQQIRDLKRDLRYERRATRDLREQQRFGAYYGRPVVYFKDGFSPLFWMWAIDRMTHDQRAEWAYHHRDTVDPARMEELRRQDAEFDRRLDALEAQGLKRDPTYAPEGVDKDLMYSREYMDTVHKEVNKSSFPWGWTIIGIIAVGLVVYVVRFKKFAVED